MCANARQRFGLFAYTVLSKWGMRSSDDVGEIVFQLIDAGILSRQESDRRSDFDGVADFHEFAVGPLSARPGWLTAPSATLHPTTLINEAGYENFGLVRVTKEAFVLSVLDEAGATRFFYRIAAR